MSSSTLPPPSDPPRAVLVAADPLPALARLGAAFADVRIAEPARVTEELEGPEGAGAPADLVVIVHSDLAPAALSTLAAHVATRPGRLLALVVAERATSLRDLEAAGLRLVGSGRLGELAVTWWVAASAPEVDLAALPGGAPLPARSDAVTTAGFAAQAELLRTALEAAPPGEAPPPSASRSTRPSRQSSHGDPPSGHRPEALRLRHRVALAGGLVAAGLAAGTAVGMMGENAAAAAALVAAAAVLLALSWGLVTIRDLARQVQQQAVRTKRLGKEVDRGLRFHAKQSQAHEARYGRIRDLLRQIDTRVAVLSSARVVEPVDRASPPPAARD